MRIDGIIAVVLGISTALALGYVHAERLRAAKLEELAAVAQRALHTGCPPRVEGLALESAHVSEADGTLVLTCEYRTGRWRWMREMNARKGVKS